MRAPALLYNMALAVFAKQALDEHTWAALAPAMAGAVGGALMHPKGRRLHGAAAGTALGGLAGILAQDPDVQHVSAEALESLRGRVIPPSTAGATVPVEGASPALTEAPRAAPFTAQSYSQAAERGEAIAQSLFGAPLKGSVKAPGWGYYTSKYHPAALGQDTPMVRKWMEDHLGGESAPDAVHYLRGRMLREALENPRTRPEEAKLLREVFSHTQGPAFSMDYGNNLGSSYISSRNPSMLNWQSDELFEAADKYKSDPAQALRDLAGTVVHEGTHGVSMTSGHEPDTIARLSPEDARPFAFGSDQEGRRPGSLDFREHDWLLRRLPELSPSYRTTNTVQKVLKSED